MHVLQNLLEVAVLLVSEDSRIGQRLSINQQPLLEVTLLIIKHEKFQLGPSTESFGDDLVLYLGGMLFEAVLPEES